MLNVCKPTVWVVCMCLLAMVSLGADDAGPMRTWTHKGKAVKGKYIGFDDGKVKYQPAKGDAVSVPLSELSQADQVFVKSRTEPMHPPVEPKWLDGFAVRYPLRVISLPEEQTPETIMASVPTGDWSLGKGADIVVQHWNGDIVPTKVRPMDADGNAIIQFPRQDYDRWYWAYVHNPKAVNGKMQGKPGDMKEGIVGELRQWKGDSLESWDKVREGLIKSEPITASVMVEKVVQSSHPTRPGQRGNFTASYRGYLNIDKPGVYRLFVNAHDAAFLFIDGHLIDQHTGQNNPTVGRRIPLESVGTNYELTKGLHHFEVHQAIGDHRNAYGMLALMWLPPGSKTWKPLPSDAYARIDVRRCDRR